MLQELNLQNMGITELLNGENIYNIQSEEPESRERLKAVLFARLAELQASKETVAQIKKTFLELDRAERQLAAQYTREHARKNANIPLKFDGKGNPMCTIENFLMIMRNDEYFSNIKFNDLSYRYERKTKKGYEEWKNVDDSKAKEYIEAKYHIHHESKFSDSLRIAFDEHHYHPVKEVIEAVKWDGKPRIETLFIKWLKCEDSAYTREVTRLVFAGGIHRIYNPGCKFDDVCVLVGTSQGEGKSTFVRWLALEDRFFTEIKNIDTKDDKECLQGKWICELAELMAVTRNKEVENVKAFITTQSDRYRMAYDKRTEDYPRQCVFVGTTNKEQFLTDKTGNRRWYPLKVKSTGYELYENKEEIQSDILQCWAEAKALFDEGKLQPFAGKHILEEIRLKQAEACEADYRVGLIEQYLKTREKTCILDIWKNALENDFSKPTRKESNDICLILQSVDGWEKGKPERFEDYGVQLCWRKTQAQIEKELKDGLPNIDEILSEWK